MSAEVWELRREARRCTYAAMQEETERGERMMLGYARFYQTLASTAEDERPVIGLAATVSAMPPPTDDSSMRPRAA